MIITAHNKQNEIRNCGCVYVFLFASEMLWQDFKKKKKKKKKNETKR